MRKSYPIQHDFIFEEAELENPISPLLPVCLGEPYGQIILFSSLLKMRSKEEMDWLVRSIPIRLFEPTLLIDCWPEESDQILYDYANLLLCCFARLLSSSGIAFSILFA